MNPDTITLKCVGLGCEAESKPVEAGRSIGHHSEETGFQPFFNVGNGLTVDWCCPACSARVLAAVEALETVFGLDRLQNLAMSGFVRMRRKT